MTSEKCLKKRADRLSSVARTLQVLINSRRMLLTVVILLTLLLPSRAVAVPTIYVLAVRESQGMWTNHLQLDHLIRRYLRKAADDLGLEVDIITVSSIEEWEKLVSDAPYGVVIINAHGELVPVPPKYECEWRDFYRDLAINVMERGWVWVNPIGYGFYYVTCNYTKVDDEWRWQLITVGPAGLDIFGGWLGIVAIAWPETAGGTLKITDLGKHVSDVLGYNLPETPNAPRPITTNVPAKWMFYQLQGGNVTAYACAAFEVGKGALLWGGWSWFSIEEQAVVATAMTLYYLYPVEIEQAQPKQFTPVEVGVISFGVACAVVIMIIVVLLLRRR